MIVLRTCFANCPNIVGTIGTFYTTVFTLLAARATYRRISQIYIIFITLYSYIISFYLYHAFLHVHIIICGYVSACMCSYPWLDA